MPRIPDSVAHDPLVELVKQHLTHRSQGKVREMFPLSPELLLIFATNRISAYDVVLATTIPNKGRCLTGISAHWFGKVLTQPTHFVAAGKGIDDYLPAALRNNWQLQQQAMVVRKLKTIPVECIVRQYITGSALKAYKNNNGVVCGIQLPEGLENGDKLPEPIFTPTTKAEEGHDEHLDAARVIAEYGDTLRARSLQAFMATSNALQSMEWILCDTKFEFGIDPDTGEPVLIDEAVTPDSSRFWEDAAYKARKPGTIPDSYDKQLIRNYLETLITPKGMGVSRLDPNDPADVAWVHEHAQLPQSVIDQSRARYAHMYQVITGEMLL